MSPSLVFYRGGSPFAVRLTHVRRICALGDVLPLQQPAQDVEGVVADGSHIVPVIVAPLPALKPGEPRVRVLLLDNGESPFGFKVDAVAGPRLLVPADPEHSVPDWLDEALSEVPREAVEGLLCLGPSQPAGLTGAMPTDLIIMLNPAPLYRARALPEEG